MTPALPRGSTATRWPQLALLLALLAEAAWLWLAPPRIRLANTHDVVARRSLAWQPTMDASLLSVTSEQQDAIERYLGSDADDPAYSQGKEEALLHSCDEARQNRQTFLMVALGAVLALLIVVRTARPAGSPPSVTTPSSSTQPTSQEI